ncbi:alternative ribosome rescue aminoacyl-tRNA hydrolase ArfB [Bartonella sp. DGB2]|uniref:alternative ribosome rescue aminoacyl-tRNA hydrolase ArfB n=1 Tax=Bartonella sp. DGB2 TaxID=3388426 RepID=UPI00398FE6C6
MAKSRDLNIFPKESSSPPFLIKDLLNPPFVEESFLSFGGPGGQNVNKVACGVQLRFFPILAKLPPLVHEKLNKLAGQRLNHDGSMLIKADRFRSLARNRADARARLCALLEEAFAPPPKARRKTRPTKASIERRLVQKTNRANIKKQRGRYNPFQD